MKSEKKAKTPLVQRDDKAADSRRKKKMAYTRRIRLWVLKAVHFIERDIWRLSKEQKPSFFVSMLKVLTITIMSYPTDKIAQKASALAYSTVVAIIPLLAVIIGIAKGFGVQGFIANFFEQYGPMHEDEWKNVYAFIENTLNYTNSGLFVGVGLITLFYTVYSLLSTVEVNLNEVWEVPRDRSVKQQIIAYFSILLLVPIMMVAAGGITLAMSALRTTFLGEGIILSTTTAILLKLLPFAILIFTFTGLFMALPNTKVRFAPAFIAGTIAGVAFQLFQLLYVSGVVWASRYNAIYGSFATFFLLLLWMQLTWLIMLFCAKLAYVIQNIDSFFYFKEVENVSRRYSDFVTIVVASKIVECFLDPDTNKPYTAQTLAEDCAIPIRMVHKILEQLLRLGVIVEVLSGRKREGGYYLPAGDPERITAGYIYQLLDKKGREDFDIDKVGRFRAEWKTTLASRKGFKEPPASCKLKDFTL